MNKFYLFDSFAMIFRAYFAMQKNPLINSKGQNVSAISGFVSTLWEIITKYQPTHIACAFDSVGPTLRHEEYEQYKANRAETPEDIIFAIPYIKEIIKAFNIPVVELDGYEADDIIGTLAQQAAQQNISTYIVTMDKDLGQMVSDSIFIHRPPYMGNPAEVYGITEICNKWSITEPKQLIDILGLMGDSIDNIPGVAGIGEKTAQKLIQEFGSIENIYNNIEEIKGKLKDKLTEQKEQAFLSKNLATVYTDVPIKFDATSYQTQTPNKEKLSAIFADLEFRTLGKRILGNDYDFLSVKNKQQNQSISLDLFSSVEVDATPSITTNIKTIANVPHQYHLINSSAAIKELMTILAQQSRFCFDTETTSVVANNCELVGISFSYQPHDAYYIPFPKDAIAAQDVIAQIKPILENEAIVKIGQNIKFDILVLRQYDIHVKGSLWDTMLAHYLIEPDAKHNMNVLAENYLNYQPISIETLIGPKGKKQGNMKDVAIPIIKDYAAEDADITLQLHERFIANINNTHLHELFYNVESPLIAVLSDMEHEGIHIDVSFLNNYSKELHQELVQAQDTIFSMAGVAFNLDSPKQLGDVLFEHLKIPYQGKKTKTGAYVTDEEMLQKIIHHHPIVEQISNYRELTKLKSTYVDTLPNLIHPKTNRLHTTFNQTIAATGRLSSINPNLQNIPIRTERGKKIRQAFIPRDEQHVLLSADYSQIELRIVASVSGDEHMIQAFKEGQDIHTATASKVFKVAINDVTSEMRRKAKMVNFGIIYGISAFGLAQRLGISRTEAAELIDAYFSQYQAIKNYMDKTITFAKQHEYVSTLLGRRRYIRDINSSNWTIRGFAERNAINAPIQGSAADMIKIAMINIHKQLKQQELQSKLLLQVHDELVFDVPKNEQEIMQQLVTTEMQNALPLSVPIEVSSGFGKNWLQAH